MQFPNRGYTNARKLQLYNRSSKRSRVVTVKGHKGGTTETNPILVAGLDWVGWDTDFPELPRRISSYPIPHSDEGSWNRDIAASLQLEPLRLRLTIPTQRNNTF